MNELSSNLNLPAAAPELFMLGWAIILLMVGVYHKNNPIRLIGGSALAVSLVTILVIYFRESSDATAFNGSYSANMFTDYVKIIMLIALAASIMLTIDFMGKSDVKNFELPILMIFATIGMMMMVSSNDLPTLYLGLEMQSLSLYVMAAIRRDSAKATEAGLKYFVLGALSSGMLLYGISLIYGFTGHVNYNSIATSIASQEQISLGLLFGIMFVLAGLAFKISAAPFHMWTPDVYEGAPTPIVAFFASAPKFAAVAVIIRLTMEVFGSVSETWQQVIIFLSIASMFVGGIAAIAQTNIQRLMAYSSIGHMGFALVALSAGLERGVQSVLLYMTIYMAMSLAAFAVIQSMQRNGHELRKISDFAGLAKDKPVISFLFALNMFSMIGIPPLAGFFGKFYGFLSAVEAGLLILAVIGVIFSAIASFYYLRIIKVMYFDSAENDPVDKPSLEIKVVLGLSSLVILFFVFYPSLILSPTSIAAKALLN